MRKKRPYNRKPKPPTSTTALSTTNTVTSNTSTTTLKPLRKLLSTQSHDTSDRDGAGHGQGRPLGEVSRPVRSLVESSDRSPCGRTPRGNKEDEEEEGGGRGRVDDDDDNDDDDDDVWGGEDGEWMDEEGNEYDPDYMRPPSAKRMPPPLIKHATPIR